MRMRNISDPKNFMALTNDQKRVLMLEQQHHAIVICSRELCVRLHSVKLEIH